MKWVKKLPTKPGIYLRNNPVTIHIVRQDLFLIDGELCAGGEGLSAVRLHKWYGAETFWWFGPIPKPPHNHSKGTP